MLEDLVTTFAGYSFLASHLLVLTVLILCGLGLPVPEDIILVSGGVLTWLEHPVEPLTLVKMITHPAALSMVVTGLIGILIGDSIIFFAGRRIGSRLTHSRWFRSLVTPAKMRRVERMMLRHGNAVVMIARFLPGLRAPTYFTVGHAGFSYWQFLLYDFLAALISAPLWVLLGFWFGNDIRLAAEKASEFSHYVLGGVALIVVAFIVYRVIANRRARQD
ncbi:MAG TPA: DedA family protein [Oligoflexales bacterium]|jgi:membrane protein DedA with SNARE-associated domain|nr:DedA family protein [Oligoflexales bacterium]